MTIGGAILAVALIMTGGVSSLWLHQADEARHTVEAAVASFNMHGPVAPGGPPAVLRFASITVTGYPFKLEVSLVKPTLRIPIPSFGSHGRTKTRDNRKREQTAWTEVVSAPGVTASAWVFNPGDVTVSIDGPVRDESIAGKHLLAGSVSTSDGASCRVAGGRDSRSALLRRDILVRCEVRDMHATDGVSHAPLATVGEASLAFDDQPAGANRRLHLAFDVRGLRYFPAADAYMHKLIDRIAASGGEHATSARMIPLSAYGSTERSADLGYEGPVDAAGLMRGAVPVRLDVERWDGSDDLSTYSTTLHASTDGRSNAASERLDIHSRTDVHEKYMALVRALAAGPQAKSNDYMGVIYQALARMPDLHALSPLRLDLTLSGNLFKPRASEPADRSLDLDTFGIDTAAWGLRMQGMAATENRVPTIDLTITARNADELITEAGAFGSAFEGVVAGPRSAPRITPERIEQTRSFLHRIALAPEHTAPNLVFRIEQRRGGQLTVSGHGMAELAGAFAEAYAGSP